jgi:predicted metalloprotease with PDZ domain
MLIRVAAIAFISASFALLLARGDRAVAPVHATTTTVVANLGASPTVAQTAQLSVVDIGRSDFESMLLAPGEGLASVAGFHPGDQLLSVNSENVGSAAELDLHSLASSNVLDLGVSRRGELARVIVLIHNNN